jgi:uncharacterized protein (TIGR03067 family)
LTDRGRQDTDELKVISKITIKGNNMRFIPNGKADAMSMTFTLMPGKSPKAIDLVPSEGPKKGAVLQGNYELKGDKLRICVADGLISKNRPTEFSSTEANGTGIFELERVKK